MTVSLTSSSTIKAHSRVTGATRMMWTAAPCDQTWRSLSAWVTGSPFAFKEISWLK